MFSGQPITVDQGQTSKKIDFGGLVLYKRDNIEYKVIYKDGIDVYTYTVSMAGNFGQVPRLTIESARWNRAI
jgi:hypothetical protein